MPWMTLSARAGSLSAMVSHLSGSRLCLWTPAPISSSSERIGSGSLVMSAASPISLTSLHGPSATSFDCPGTRLNIRSDRSRTTFFGVVPRATACRARSLTRMSQSFQPGNPLRRLNTTGRGLAEHRAPAWEMGSISSSIWMRSFPRASRKSRRFSAMGSSPFAYRDRGSGPAQRPRHPQGRPQARYHQGQENDQEGRPQEAGGDGMHEEDRHAAPREQQRLSDGFLRQAAQHEGEHEWHRLVLEFLHEVAEAPEGQHDDDVPDVGRHGVDPNYAEEQDQGKEHAVRDL